MSNPVMTTTITDQARLRGTARAKGRDVAHSDTAIADYFGRGHSSIVVSYQSSDRVRLMCALHSRGESTERIDTVLGWLS